MSRVTGEPIVSCEGLERTYRIGAREVSAVRGVDLEVEAGEWVAIMGPSGCGKSSLLHLLGGLDTADAGSVVVAGEELGEMSETGRALMRRSRIGYVFQFFNLVQDFTVAENIELPMLLSGSSRSAARRRRDELLEAVGLSEYADSSPSQLSGGQQQRVAIARALANRPAILFADEPTGNLDTESARQVLALLREQHDAGQTIVMVTHDPRVGALADRLLLMEDGRFTAETTAPGTAGPTLQDLSTLTP
jgi:putative ABC transport system ATP-binding protein